MRARRITVPEVRHRWVEVQGLRLFVREAGPEGAPALLLLHGFPSASHQYARLVDALAGEVRVIAPDYPGSGQSELPAPGTPARRLGATFDGLADAMEGLCQALGLGRFTAYLFDYGAPVGLRLALRHPEWIAGLVIQNGNAYEEGLSPLARRLSALRPGTPGAAGGVLGVLTPEAVRAQHLDGAQRPERVSPDGWTLDVAALERPGRRELQVELALDYHANVAAYPAWQAWLRAHRPPALVLWGRNDPFFVEAGAWAYRRDLPDADVRVLDAGHFALDERLADIAPRVAAFVAGRR